MAQREGWECYSFREGKKQDPLIDLLICPVVDPLIVRVLLRFLGFFDLPIPPSVLPFSFLVEISLPLPQPALLYLTPCNRASGLYLFCSGFPPVRFAHFISDRC